MNQLYRDFELLRQTDDVVGAAIGDGQPTIDGLKLACLQLAKLLDERTEQLQQMNQYDNARLFLSPLAKIQPAELQ